MFTWSTPFSLALTTRRLPVLIQEFERREQKLTIRDVAALSGIAAVRISYSEKGTWRLTPQELEAVARVLDVFPPERLLEPVPDRTAEPAMAERRA
jgi:transcriptional regulator with XRE-family HTH domain